MSNTELFTKIMLTRLRGLALFFKSKVTLILNDVQIRHRLSA